MSPFDYLLHFGNVLYLLAFAVRDILWLRIIIVVGTLCLLPYFFCCSASPLYAPITWNLLFLSVNIVQITRLILERQPVFLGEKEQQLYRMNFQTLTPREFVRLLSIADWKQAIVGEELLSQGHPISELMLLASGRGTVEIDGRYVAEVTSGQFVGEMGFLTNEEASARVVTVTPTEYLTWPVERLRELLNQSPDLHVKVQGILGNDLVEKLRQESMDAAHPSRIIKPFK